MDGEFLHLLPVAEGRCTCCLVADSVALMFDGMYTEAREHVEQKSKMVLEPQLRLLRSRSEGTQAAARWQTITSVALAVTSTP